MSHRTSRHKLVPRAALAAIILSLAAAEATAQAPPMLPETVVSATGIPTPLREVGSAISVITADDIERKQVRLLSDVLRDIPGVSVNRSGGVPGSLTQIRVRGAEANHTLVLIDGIEVNDPSQSGGPEFDFGTLLAADIERVEVLRGPQSALYGSDAIGGVINIITKRGKGKPSATLRAEGGSFGTLEGAAAVRGGGERYHYALSANRLHSDGISAANERRGNRERDTHDNRTLHARLGASPLENLDLDFVGRETRNFVQGDGFTGGIGAIDDGSDAKLRQRFARAQGKLALFDGGWEHIVGGSVAESQRDFQTAQVQTSLFDGKKRKLDYQTNVLFKTPEVARAGHTLTFGFDAEEDEVKSKSAFTDVNRRIDTRGYVGQYKLDLLDRVFLTGAMRFDQNDFFADSTTYRTSTAYLHKETDTKLRASVANGVKNPSIFELFGYTATFVGNPRLTPESGWGWDAAVEQGFLGRRIVLETGYFRLLTDDLIAGAGNTAVNLNGVTVARGVETSARAAITTDLDATLGYTYTLTRDPSGNELVRRAKHIASAGLAHRFLDGRARLNLDVRYNGGQKDLEFDAFFDSRRVRLDGYTLVNLGASYRLTDEIDAFVRIENLLDEKYEEVLTFGTPGIGAFGGLRVRIGG